MGTTQDLDFADLQKKNSLEWNLNDWNWDGHKFLATRATQKNNHLNLCLSSSELKRGREEVVLDDDDSDKNYLRDEELSLNLGNINYDKNGKKVAIVTSSSRGVCQVDTCCADLSCNVKYKPYHRRHKVCIEHSKASSAVVGNVVQRFCQQCSRFHKLEAFDESKKSCRERLDGHNKRRRKTLPEAVVDGGSIKSSNFILILLRILSNVYESNSGQLEEKTLFSHLARNLSCFAGTNDKNSLYSSLLQFQNSFNMGVASRTLSEINQHTVLQDLTINGNSNAYCPQLRTSVEDNMILKSKVTGLDLNTICCDPEDCADGMDKSPPQTNGNSDSASAPSPSNSSGDQSCTDRIVFKLFGKSPSHFPMEFRSQILNWLSNSPTEILSYIKPGCVYLTIYARLTKSKWEELANDLGSTLSRLLDVPDTKFWRTGWIVIRVRQRVAIIYDGQIVLDTHFTLEDNNEFVISSVTPIAVPRGERVEFVIDGANLDKIANRFICILQGTDLIQQSTKELVDGADSDLEESDEFQSLRFECFVPEINERGFIEVEDDGLGNSFFPFLVVDGDMCSEIRMLESVIEVEYVDDVHLTSEKFEAKSQALEFIQEIGWLLHRSHLRFRLGDAGSNSQVFPFARFKWILQYSMDRDWCAVVKNLLDILFDGTVSLGEYSSIKLALSDFGLLHNAVKRNCRKMVELLLHYTPDEGLDISKFKYKQILDSSDSFLFQPDAHGPGGWTPLHIAANSGCSESVLDALTDDPGSVGIVAWKNARDATGTTPEDYARQRENFNYINLVHRKLNKNSNRGHAVLDIPNTFQIDNGGSTSIQIHTSCKLCEQKLAYKSFTKAPGYRPAMLSMLAIAAVCVCVALLFKSSPEVQFVYPFRWELLHYGSF